MLQVHFGMGNYIVLSWLPKKRETIGKWLVVNLLIVLVQNHSMYGTYQQSESGSYPGPFSKSNITLQCSI